MNWLPYPRPGTHFLDGRWMVTLKNLHTGTLSTEIMNLENGRWPLGDPRDPDYRIVSIAQVPEPKEFK